jgi:hypothetical protein
MKNLIITICFALVGIAATAQRPAVYKSYTQTLNDTYCTGLFKSTHGTIVDVASDNTIMGYVNILNWLQGRVAGLMIYTNRYGHPIPVIRGSIPGVYLNEMWVDPSFMSVLPVADIAMIKVIKTPFYGGINGGGGAIAIYTIKGEETDEDEDSY